MSNPAHLHRSPRLKLRIFLRFTLRISAAAAVSAAAPPVPAAVCSPPALGAPCAAGGLATLGATGPTPSLQLGNPVHLATGNKYQLDVDLPSNPSTPGLELVRHYNSLSVQAGPLGRGWSMSYDTRLVRRGKGWFAVQADGSERSIAAPVAADDGTQAWHWPNGRELTFDPDGRLIRVRMQNGPAVHILRHAAPDPRAGLIERVSSAGHDLRFEYDMHVGTPLLTAVRTPLGHYRYHYETPPKESGHSTPRLSAVTRPDGMRRLYHYEPERQAGNPHALTGISLGAGGKASRRLATWSYDRSARVISAHLHGRGGPAYQIEYVRAAVDGIPGLTRVRSDLGDEQWLHFRRHGRGYHLLNRHDGRTPNAGAGLHYDERGRLLSVEGLRLVWSRWHAPSEVHVGERGWPGLRMRFDRDSNTYSWHSRPTGWTTLTGDAATRPAELRHANGDTLHIRYDTQGRPARLAETRASDMKTVTTRLWWKGARLARVQHPEETETRHYDTLGRLAELVTHRPAQAGAPAATYRDAFRYDDHGRVLSHELPEGGALHYAWRDDGPRRGALAAITWEDAEGRRHPVVTSTAAAGYRYGNGLAMTTGALHGPHADALLLSRGNEALWVQQRRYDAAGRITSDVHHYPAAALRERLAYVHDERSRLQGARHESNGGTTRAWYAWRDDGRLAALAIDGVTSWPGIPRDASGLPQRRENGPPGNTRMHYTLSYGPGRRLEAVSPAAGGAPVARYHHNTFGFRIASLTADGYTRFLRLDGRVAAEARADTPASAPRIVRRYIYAGFTPVGMIDYPVDAPGRLYAVHADLSGAARMITDDTGRMRWLASYTPTGRAQRVRGDMAFPLRLPGQYEDAATGLHDNVLRTYDPDVGQFLEPDPLGPMPGTDVFGYATQQPWRYADPHGLLLFAFDGTRQSADTLGNVWKLAQAYRDGAAHYHSGPGNSDFLDWDAVVAWRAGRILENQWQALLTAVEQQPRSEVLPIDIVGFSRGAALARHFGNRIAGHVREGVFSIDDPMRGRLSACVDLRFMGLFDTVAQFGINGSHNHLYDLGVSELWSWVSHAVAMHEHRWAFPLSSADAGGAGNVVEAPFIGAHADIGGGIALREPHAPPGGAAAVPADAGPESDLADVALAWMHWQALAANVRFDALQSTDAVSERPVLRDMRSPLLRTVQRGDRAVLHPSGAHRYVYQNDDPRVGRAAREQTEAFITRMENWRMRAGEDVGVVDMEGYSQWLSETLGWPAR